MESNTQQQRCGNCEYRNMARNDYPCNMCIRNRFVSIPEDATDYWEQWTDYSCYICHGK